MKLILSRKGLDSSKGEHRSPILPDGRIYSLPIPTSNYAGGIPYERVQCGEDTAARILSDLGIDAGEKCHLDPDLRFETVERSPGWRPLFGQLKGAQGHLRKQGVGTDDLFLFFGLFCETEKKDGCLQYVRGASPQHVLFGWMKVGEIVRGTESIRRYAKRNPWASDHPHVQIDEPQNTLYVARDREAGAFETYHTDLRLTAAGEKGPKVWALPSLFLPKGRPPLTYHKEADFRLHDDQVRLESAAPGQEFVLDCDLYTEALSWADELIAKHRTAQ